MNDRCFLYAWRGAFLSVLGLALPGLLMGCGTVQKNNDRMQGQVSGFPSEKPGLVRLPVEIVFPNGGDVVQHLTNLFKGGLKQLIPDWNALPGLHMQSHITELWSEMQEPIYLGKDFWLLIRPETLGIGRAQSDLRRVTTAHMVLEMTARPEIVFGPKPENNPIPIPTLQPVRQGPGIFQATSNARFSYKEADLYFQKPEQGLIGRVLSGKGERKLTLAGIRFYGSAGQMVIETKLLYGPPILNLSDHPTQITVHLRGTPRYLPKERVFDFPDMDFDIESGNLLVKIAGWIYKTHYRNELRKLTHIPIGPKLDWMKGRIDLALNRPLSRFTRLKTQVNSFKVLGGFADEEGIEIRVSIQGTSILQVIWN